MFARRAVKAVAITTVALLCGAGSLAIAETAYAGTGVGASGNTVTNAVQAQSPFTPGTFDSGQPIDVVIPANTVLAAGANAFILECAAPGGVNPTSASACDGSTGYQGGTITIQPDGSLDVMNLAADSQNTTSFGDPYSVYALPDAPVLHEPASSTPKCGLGSANECVLYIGESSTDFSQPHFFSQAFQVHPDPTDSGTLTPGDGTFPADSAPGAISTANHTTFTQGAAATFSVTATGYGPPAYTETGALPTGVTLKTTYSGLTSTGVLAGTPTQSGVFPITITANNGVGTPTTQDFTLTVNGLGTAPTITSVNHATFTEGTAGTFTATATGSPAPTFTEVGPLATGVTLSTAGVLSGTPTTSGAFPITITAANGVTPDATQSFTLDVLAPPGVYVPLTPTRVCDTRANNPSHLTGPAAQCTAPPGSGSETLPPGGTLTFDVAGDFLVPASDVTAVVLSVATANSKGPGHFTLFPAGATMPVAANLNYATGQVVPNLVEVGVGAGGAVSLYTSASSDAIVDLEGYVTTTPQSGAGLYNALSTPARLCDTRGSNPSGLTGGATQCNTNLAHPSPDNLIGPTNPLTINVEGVGGVPATGVSAVVLNVAVAKAASAGYVTVYPTGVTRPGASNVNYTTGTAVGNRVIVPVSGSGQVTLYATAATDIIVDVSGWFTATGGTTGAEFTPEVDPTRICDTRGSNPSGLVAPNTQCNTNTAHGSPDNPLVAGTSDTIQATGLASVPAGATAAVLNLADVVPSAGSNLTVYPTGVPPTTSDVNPPVGGVASNLVVATLTGSGSFEVANRGSGHTDIVIDVAGWYTTPG